MGLIYDLYPTPTPKESKRKPTLHARVVSSETVSTESLAEIIADRSTVNAGEVKAVLDLLSNVLIWELSQGRHVHLDGLGYFHLTLNCPPVESEKEIRSESVSVRNIVFRPEQKLKNKTKTFKLKRAEKKRTKRKSISEIEHLLAVYFSKHPCISTREFGVLCGLANTTAKRIIKQLADEGKVRRIGQNRLTLYMACEK